MINEKIDHHFNELSPIDFNIFGDISLYHKLIKENLAIETAQALHDHITIIKEQIDSVLNQEDEHLAVVYNFLSHEEQNEYQAFLAALEADTSQYLQEKS